MENYYEEHKNKLLKMFHTFMDNYFQSYYVQKFPTEDFTTLKMKALQEYESLIPTIPYIGGFKNNYTLYLVGAPLVVALYKSIEGITDDEFGELIFEPFGDYLTPHNKLVRWLSRLIVTSSLGKRSIKKRATQTPIYAKEWKIEYVEDVNDKDLIYTMKYTKCGLQEYMKELGYDHLTPYLCILDYRTLGNLKIGFKRTQTIAMGGTYCDFQFRRNTITPVTWNPDKFTEYATYKKQK